MKVTRIPNQMRIALLAAVALAAAAPLSPAQSGIWTNDISGLWSDTASWIDGVVASGAANTASFSNELGSAVEVSVDSARTIGNLSFVQGVYTITNNGVDANVLTLAGPPQPVINVPSGQAATIRRVQMGGSDGFVLDGGGTLNLFKENTDPANTLTGGVVISNGTIQVQGLSVDNDNEANTLALGSISSFTFMNGTLNIQPAPNTSPSYGNVNGDLIVPEGGVGTLVLPVRFSGASGDNAATAGSGLGGSLTGSGTFNVLTRYVRGNVVGDWSMFGGQLNISPGSASAIDQEFRFGDTNGLPNASVDLGGSSYFTFRYYRQLTGPTVFPVGRLSGGNSAVFVTGSSSAGQTLIYRVGSLMTNEAEQVTFAGTLVNGAGPLALIKEGVGTWILTASNTYSGFTTISNGVLQIGDGASEGASIGTGPITNYSGLVLATGGTMTVPGIITGPGGLTNMGIGTATLLGANTYTGPTAITAGKLVLGTASAATGGYTAGDSATLGVLRSASGATLTTSSIQFGGGTALEFDLATFGNPAVTVVSNTGAISLNGDVTVNITGTNLTTGPITLLRYGSRTGTGAFVLGSLPGNVTDATLQDDTANNQVVLTINSVFIPPDSTLKWLGGVAGIWDIDNTANQIWQEIFSSIITNYYDGAPVRFDDSATGTTTVDVSTVVSPASVVVSNSVLSYTFNGGGSIAGAGFLVKQGSGTAVLNTANSYSGITAIESGILQVGDGTSAATIGTGTVTNNTTLLFNSTADSTISSIISGSGVVVQKGPGILTLSGVNTHTGGVQVQDGAILALNNNAAAGAGGSVVISNATVTPGATILGGNAVIVIGDGVIGTNTANRQIDAPIRGTNATLTFSKTGGLMTLNGNLSEFFGTITNDGTGLLRFNSGGGNTCFGSSNTLFVLNAGSFLQNRNGGIIDLGAVSGSGTIGSPQNANNQTVNFRIGGLNTSTVFEGTVNDNNTNVNNRLTGTIKVGTGTLTMNNATLTYFGPTVVSNGVLALTGSSGLSNSTAVTVVSPGVLNVTGRDSGTLFLGQPNELQPTRVQTLRGDGIIQGNVVLGSLARLEPGAAANVIGNLTCSGSVSLGGTNVFEVTATGTPASDQLIAAGIDYGGTLILTNLGTITGSNTFKLFHGALSGSFANVVTPTLSGVTWDISMLSVDGTVTLVGPPGVSTTPTNITTSVSEGTLTLAWPASHLGWRLEAQTNSLSTGLSPNWSTVSGSTTVTQMNLTIGSENGAVFFRLVYP